MQSQTIWPVDLHSVSIIPDWLYQYTSQKGIGTETFLSDIVLDDRLTMEDIAVILALNDAMTIGNDRVRLSTYNLVDHITRPRPLFKEALDTKIRQAYMWSLSETIKKELETRFGASSSGDVPWGEAGLPYFFVASGPKIWLVVGIGFIQMLRNPETRLAFYRDYLSTVGKYVSFHSVNQTEVFARYVQELIG